MGDSKFPWDLLKAESLRTVCRDLGAANPRKRDDMVSFLDLVGKQGLDAALEADANSEPQRQTTKVSSGSKRKSEKEGVTELHDYDTRNRGKRARQSDSGTRRLVTRSGGSASHAPVAGSSRRKSKGTTTTNTTVVQEEVFDGVLVPRRVSYHGKANEKEETDLEMDGGPSSLNVENGTASETVEEGNEEGRDSPIHDGSNKGQLSLTTGTGRDPVHQMKAENESLFESAEEQAQERASVTALDQDVSMNAALENDPPKETADSQNEPEPEAEIQIDIIPPGEDPVAEGGQDDGNMPTVETNSRFAMTANNTEDCLRLP